MSLIFKYTPRSIEDFDIDANKLFHETHLLLIGGEQTGKTTLVNILVKKYLPHDHVDHVLYINNLKEQGIQYYRTEVKNFCQTTCFENHLHRGFDQIPSPKRKAGAKGSGNNFTDGVWHFQDFGLPFES